MKKLFALFSMLIVMLSFVTSCALIKYSQNEWFSEEKLTKCIVPDLPEPQCSYVKEYDGEIFVKFTETEYETYLNAVYGYLLSQNFEHLGTRAALYSSLSGAFNTYYFEPANSLAEFYSEGVYRFVYSDGKISTGEDDMIFCILTVSKPVFSSSSTLEYRNKTFDYNTRISLRFNSEYPLGGRYVLHDSEHEHIYGEWQYDENFHWCSWVCTWDACDIDTVAEHYDDDGDGKCDACGYRMSEPTPTNHFLRNHAGCEWLNEIAADNIAEVKMISEAVGVAPGNLKNISSSTDKATMSRIFDEYYWLDTSPVSRENGQVDGGGAVTVKFILNDGNEKELYINNGNYRDTDGNYFELLYTPKFGESDNVAEAYGFITYIGTGTVYDGENNLVCEIPIDELEFDYNLNLDLPDFELYDYDMVVKTEFGDLKFIAPTVFYTEGGAVFVLVGKNLDELISDYGEITKEYTLTMNDTD